MKKGKNPNVRQKRILDAQGYNPNFYLIIKEVPLQSGITQLYIVDRESGEEFLIEYERSAPFANAYKL